MIDALTRVDWARVPEAAKAFIQRFLDMVKNEPWVFGLPVGGEREFLGDVGLELRESLTIGGDESVKRYLTRSDGTQVGAEALAKSMARMAERARASGPSSAEAQAMSPERMREQQRVMAYQLAEAIVP